MNQYVLPKALTYRPSEDARRWLERLMRIRSEKHYVQVIDAALRHMLASYERRESIHTYVPSEVRDELPGDDLSK